MKVCGARFRETRLCSRCGADLSTLMYLVTMSHRLRERARASGHGRRPRGVGTRPGGRERGADARRKTPGAARPVARRGGSAREERPESAGQGAFGKVNWASPWHWMDRGMVPRVRRALGVAGPERVAAISISLLGVVQDPTDDASSVRGIEPLPCSQAIWHGSMCQMAEGK